MEDRSVARAGVSEAAGCDLQLALGLADALARVGRLDDAVAQYASLAEALEARGQIAMALSAYRMMGSLAAFCVQTQLRCADAYARAGLPRDAVAIWDWAAGALAVQGRQLEAADALSRAVEADPEDLGRRRGLAELYARLGMIDAAVDQLDAIARRLLAAGCRRELVEVAERLLGLRRDHVPTLRTLARAHLLDRDLRGFVARVRSLLGVSRGDPVAGELMVEALVLAGKDRAAREAAVKVGQVLASREDAQARAVARGVVERARRRHPTDPRLHHLQEELEVEPLEEAAILEELVETDPAASADTGLIDYAHASIALRPRGLVEDGETNVYSLVGRRPASRPEVTRAEPAAVIEGRFGAVAG